MPEKDDAQREPDAEEPELEISYPPRDPEGTGSEMHLAPTIKSRFRRLIDNLRGDQRGRRPTGIRGSAPYAFTRFPDAADLSMASMTWWRCTASAKSGTVCVLLTRSAAKAA